MNRKRGFTLVELLTIIAILSLILIVATPKVLSTIESSRKTAFKNSADLIVQSVKLEYSQKLYGTDFDKKLYEFDKKEESGYKNGSNKLNIKGDKPSIGSVLLNGDGKVAMAIVSNDEKYCATKTYNEGEVSVKRYTSGGCYIKIDDTILGNINEYIVTFNDDKIETKIKVIGGNKVEKINPKGKEGYTFKYWSTTKNGNEYDFNLPVNSNMTLYAVYKEQIRYTNPNIVAAYKYDQTPGSNDYCVIGEEPTCKQISLTNENKYTSGTIVKYKVNSNTTKYFNILHDDGDTLTLQQRENTIENVKWNSDGRCLDDYGNPNVYSNNCSGPLEALAALESATSNWTNVNNQSYTTGSTIINGQVTNVSCFISTYECDSNLFSLTKTNVKARLIFLQEAVALKCKDYENCPVFMNNCSGHGSNSKCGNKEFSNSGYWTMNGSNNKYSDSVFAILTNNDIGYYDSNSNVFGARAVIVIDK